MIQKYEITFEKIFELAVQWISNTLTGIFETSFWFLITLPFQIFEWATEELINGPQWLDWFATLAGLIIVGSEQMPTRFLENSCITNFSMILVSFVNIAIEIFNFTMQPGVGSVILILQHIYDALLAVALLQECSVEDLPKIFEDIDKSLNYDYCSSENKIYYGL